MSNSDSEIKETNNNFGSVLAEARQSQNYTIEEISRHLKIPVRMISAIETSNVDLLPAPTFAQGYIRAYAKFLEISEDKVLDLYNRAVPHNRTEKLKSRSNLSNRANSQSPLIKTVTAFLIVAAIAALIYGGFQYYQKKANVMENELGSTERSFSGNSLDSPGQNPVNNAVTIEQNARLTDEDELILQPSDSIEPMPGDESDPAESDLSEAEVELETDDLIETTLETSTDVGTQVGTDSNTEIIVGELTSGSNLTESNQGVYEQLPDEQLDVLKIYAKKGSWIQVHDANDERLLYNMVPVRGSKELRGIAPFRVSLGNAETTSLLINDLAIDMSNHIRANNTASFTVSTRQQNVIFH